MVAAMVTGLMLSVTSSMAAGQCGGGLLVWTRFNGKKTASGQQFNENAMTAAHKTLPFGTVVKVTDQRTGKSISAYRSMTAVRSTRAVSSISARQLPPELGTKAAGTGKVMHRCALSDYGELRARAQSGSRPTATGGFVRLKKGN